MEPVSSDISAQKTCSFVSYRILRLLSIVVPSPLFAILHAREQQLLKVLSGAWPERKQTKFKYSEKNLTNRWSFVAFIAENITHAPAMQVKTIKTSWK